MPARIVKDGRLTVTLNDQLSKTAFFDRSIIMTGMTREEVADALGYPESINRKTVKGLFYDQWIYRDMYVYLENGTVFMKRERK